MGPGRKLYHKPCLSCNSCNKRLDSYTLLEHDQKPYCKPCHIKSFATRDLRHANLAQGRPLSLHADPPLPPLPPRVPSPVRTFALRPTRSLAANPHSPTFPDYNSAGEKVQRSADGPDPDEQRDVVPTEIPLQSAPSSSRPLSPIPSSVGRLGIGSFPRTVPLSPTRNAAAESNFATSRPRHQTSKSVPNVNRVFRNGDFEGHDPGSPDSKIIKPLPQTSTGTRYGVALTGNLPTYSTGISSKKWGGTNPVCPRCGKSVYFAEQVKAVGKTYHKGCLRCMECNSLLDSNRLRDHNNEPICVRCYGKLHGPQGSGYALLGKAGG